MTPSQPRRQLLRSFTRGDVKTAISMLRQNRGRSLATVFGIVIAVGSVILILAIGEGVKRQVQDQVDRLGKDLILVRPGTTARGLSGSLGSLSGPGTVGGLDERDLLAVASTPGVKRAVPLSTIDGTVETDDHNSGFNGPVIATNSQFLDTLHQRLEYGEFLGEGPGSDARVVIGSDVAASLFREHVPLGRSFIFHDHKFIVGGILDQFDSNPLLGDADFNNAIFIKYQVAQELTNNHAAIYQILAQAKNSTEAAETAGAITNNLRKVHGGSMTFSVLRQGQSLAATNSILDALTRFIVGAAIVTLIIGGVGIMNVMLVSVTERMHEIGIRKAVGATNRQILSQFLLESVVLSMTGAVAGFVVATVIVYLVRIYSDSLQPIMPWKAAIATAGLAVLVGALFGSIPALKAARKDPIDALRSQ